MMSSLISLPAEMKAEATAPLHIKTPDLKPDSDQKVDEPGLFTDKLWLKDSDISLNDQGSTLQAGGGSVETKEEFLTVARSALTSATNFLNYELNALTTNPGIRASLVDAVNLITNDLLAIVLASPDPAARNNATIAAIRESRDELVEQLSTGQVDVTALSNNAFGLLNTALEDDASPGAKGFWLAVESALPTDQKNFAANYYEGLTERLSATVDLAEYVEEIENSDETGTQYSTLDITNLEMIIAPSIDRYLTLPNKSVD
ncbi:MAG: hypothetical protein AAFW47_04380 [Pseudomonadota bacterium]